MPAQPVFQMVDLQGLQLQAMQRGLGLKPAHQPLASPLFFSESGEKHPAEAVDAEVEPEGQPLQAFPEIAEQAETVIEIALLCRQPPLKAIHDFLPHAGNPVFQEGGVGDDPLGSARRGGGAQVRTEVGDREIDFMSDAGDDRHARAGDGPGHNLFVEGPEIFYRPAAATEDDEIDQLLPVGEIEGGGDFLPGTLALDPDRQQLNGDRRPALPPDRQEIMDGRAAWRGNDHDFRREGGQRLFPGGIEQSFGSQFFFQLLKPDLQDAKAGLLDDVDNQLVFATLFIDRDPAVTDDLLAILEGFGEIAVLGFEQHGPDLRRTVLEDEIPVPGIGDAEIGDFPPDMDEPVVLLQQRFDRLGRLADGQDFCRVRGRHREQGGGGFSAPDKDDCGWTGRFVYIILVPSR